MHHILSSKNFPSSLWLKSGKTLLNNAIIGASKGYEKVLELSGVGYRATIKGSILNLQLGFSHDINFKIPEEPSSDDE